MAELVRYGFVMQDGLQITVSRKGIIIVGTVDCLDQLSLQVEKDIPIVSGTGPKAWVKTKSYRYHAWVRGEHNIFRYESPHPHRRYHHKHVYDPFAQGREIEILELWDERAVPTLQNAVEDLRAWHAENLEQIEDLP